MHQPGNVAFAALLVTAIVLETRIWRRSDTVIVFRHGVVALAAMLVAFTIWLLSNAGWCDPRSLVQGHAAWHLLCAVSAYWLFRMYASETRLTAEGRRVGRWMGSGRIRMLSALSESGLSMPSQHTPSRRAVVTGAAALTAAGFVAAPAPAQAHPGRHTTRLTVLGTTDLHGNVFNWDYFKNARVRQRHPRRHRHRQGRHPDQGRARQARRTSRC